MQDYYRGFPSYSGDSQFTYQRQEFPYQGSPNNGPNEDYYNDLPYDGWPNDGMPNNGMPNEMPFEQPQMSPGRQPSPQRPSGPQMQPSPQRQPNFNNQRPETPMNFEDMGPEPFALNIEEAAIRNNNYRQVIWTGEYLQVTLMSIDVDSDIGYEVHPDLDQFIRLEQGQGLVLMGDSVENLDYQVPVYDDFAFIIPAGKWHNLINTGDEPIKLYSIYAPPHHDPGAVHQTKEEAIASESAMEDE